MMLDARCTVHNARRPTPPPRPTPRACCHAFPSAAPAYLTYLLPVAIRCDTLQGLHFDCSSGYEVTRAMQAGVPADRLSLSTQELPENIAELVAMGIKVRLIGDCAHARALAPRPRPRPRPRPAPAPSPVSPHVPLLSPSPAPLRFPSSSTSSLPFHVHKVNACSLSQLRAFGEALPGADVGLRFNPGLGSGGTGKTNVGGPSSRWVSSGGL